MSLDKIVDSAALDAGLTQVADAIREKGETTGTMAFPSGFVDAVNGIPDHIPKGANIKYFIPVRMKMPRRSDALGFDTLPVTYRRENTNQLVSAFFDLVDATDNTTPGFWVQHIWWSMCETSQYQSEHAVNYIIDCHGKAGNHVSNVTQINIKKTALEHADTWKSVGGSSEAYARNGQNYRGFIMVHDSTYTGFPIVDANKLEDFLVVDGLTAGW